MEPTIGKSDRTHGEVTGKPTSGERGSEERGVFGLDGAGVRPIGF